MRPTLVALAALALCAGCDRETQQAVDKAGAEFKREAKETGADIKREAQEAGAEVKRALGEVGETTGQALSDAAITTKVKAALHAEKDIKSRDIDVDTFQGKVVIKGTVPDRAQADHAAKIAAGVDGVRAVENRLAVQ